MSPLKIVALASGAALALATAPGAALAQIAVNSNTTITTIQPGPYFLGANATLTIDKSVNTSQPLNVYGSGLVVNNGAIDSAGPAVAPPPLTFGAPNLTNNGSLATTGTAPTVTLSPFGIRTVTNNGSITGSLVGADVGVQTQLTSNGVITGGQTGVWMTAYATLINQANGVINGGVATEPAQGFTGNTLLWNAGTINGNVNLGSSNSAFTSSINRVVLQPGSVINGNLTIGAGLDTLAVNVTNTGPGALAGVTGQVIAGPSSSLHYLVASNASAAIVLPSNFTSLSYDLSNNAKLTLAGGVQTLPTIGFSGTGTVDVTETLTGVGYYPRLCKNSGPRLVR